MTTILAEDVSAAARSAGISTPVAISGGVRASMIADDDHLIGQFLRHVMSGPVVSRTEIGAALALVDMGHGHRFIVAHRTRSPDNADSIAIVTLIEAQLAGPDFDLDVRERIAPREWMQ